MEEIKRHRSAGPGPVSMEGIDQAIESLGYRSKRSAKARLVNAVREACRQSGGADRVEGVSTDDLIRTLWDINDDGFTLMSRRRNLSSLRSSINADLMDRYRSGGNPEGVIIGPDNTFVICDEAKDQALEALRSMVPGKEGGGDWQAVGEALRRIQELLERSQGHGEEAGLSLDAKAMDSLQEAVRGLAGRLDAQILEPDGRGGPGDEDASGSGEETRVLEEDQDQVYEVVDDEEAVLDDAVEDELEEVEDDQDAVDEEEPEDEIEEIADQDELEDVYEDVDLVEEGEEEEEAVGEEEEGDEDLEEAEPDQGALLVEDEVVEDEESVLDDEVEDDLEEVEDDEDAVDDVVDEEEPEDEIEEIADQDELEDVYEDVDLVEEGEGEANVTEGFDGGDLAEEGEGLAEEKSRLLAEDFNQSLAAMDRFYNQYILVPEGMYPGPSGSCRVSTFYIGKFPVTNALFEVFVEKTGYRTTAERLGYGTVYRGRYRRERDEQSGRETLHVGSGLEYSSVEGACWYQPLGPGSTLRGKRIHPVVQVSLEDAMAFAAWTGKRLPTEDEWEAAMRTVDGYGFPWGDDWKPEGCNVEESCIGDTSPVDCFADFENPLGVADGIGNVLEWTSTGGIGAEQDRRVAKGGGWIAGQGVTLESRSLLPRDSHSNILGFRCVAY